MTKGQIMPVLVAVLSAAACGGGDGPTAGGTTTPPAATTAKVRFFNAVWNAPDGVGFTTNNQFASGSALKYAQSTQTCSTLGVGSTTFGVGVANASGTGLNSNALATLNNQAIAGGGNYTVLAGGQSLHPSVVLLDNSVSGTLGANQAAVRFVNLAAMSQFPFTVLKGAVGSGATTVVQNDIAFRAATPFSTVTSGSNAYTIMYNNAPAISGNAATLNLQGGTVNTVVIVRNPSSDGFQMINVPGCP
jgi:hypothetical protein